MIHINFEMEFANYKLLNNHRRDLVEYASIISTVGIVKL